MTYTDEDLISYLQTWMMHTRFPPTTIDYQCFNLYNKEGEVKFPSTTTILRRFGTWEKYLTTCLASLTTPEVYIEIPKLYWGNHSSGKRLDLIHDANSLGRIKTSFVTEYFREMGISENNYDIKENFEFQYLYVREGVLSKNYAYFIASFDTPIPQNHFDRYEKLLDRMVALDNTAQIISLNGVKKNHIVAHMKRFIKSVDYETLI